MTKPVKVTLFGVFAWVLAALFFLYEFFLRVLPATIADTIVSDLHISIEQFAVIGSGYYLAYAIMQIPVGILLDKIPIKALVTFACGLCSFGMLWFAYSSGFTSAFISRLLIGLGSSFGYVTLMVVTLNWFPKRLFAFLAGLGMLMGTLGPLGAGAPIALMLKAFNGNWRTVFLLVAAFGVFLTLLIGFSIQGKPRNTDAIVFADRKVALGKRVRSLLASGQVWATIAFSATNYVALPLFGAFWGTSFLQTRGLEKTLAAFIVSMIWVGLAVGSPLIGRLSDLLHRRKPLCILAALVGIVATSLIIWFPPQNWVLLSVLFFCVGLGGSGMNIGFAIITEISPQSLRATALGLNNTGLMAFAALMPPFVSSIIKHYKVDGQITSLSFEKGLIVIPICFAVSLLIVLFGIRETYCRKQNTVHILKT